MSCCVNAGVITCEECKKLITLKRLMNISCDESVTKLLMYGKELGRQGKKNPIRELKINVYL